MLPKEFDRYSKFKSVRIVNGKQKSVIVNICGEILNKNPTKDDLKNIKPEISIRELCKLPGQELKDCLLEYLKYFYYKEGKIPASLDFYKNPKYPSRELYRNVFVSWNSAIRDAGLIPNRHRQLNNKELLTYLIQFYEENGRPPVAIDFYKNPKYPGRELYRKVFKSWQNALKFVGLDIDSMIKRGYIETSDQKGRLGEIFVFDHFNEIGYDLSGENKNSSCDGICPQGYNYDVKTSYFKENGLFWRFHLDSVDIDEIEWFYLLAFNEDYTKLLFAWRIPALDLIEDIEKGQIWIHVNNLESLKEYEITEKIKHIYEKWRNNLRKWTKEEILADARSKLKIYVEPKKSDIKYDKNDYDGVLKIR